MMTNRRRFTQTLLAGSAWTAAGGPLGALAQTADADQWRGIVQEIGFRADS
jgi:hypothetical protein